MHTCLNTTCTALQKENGTTASPDDSEPAAQPTAPALQLPSPNDSQESEVAAASAGTCAVVEISDRATMQERQQRAQERTVAVADEEAVRRGLDFAAQEQRQAHLQQLARVAADHRHGVELLLSGDGDPGQQSVKAAIQHAGAVVVRGGRASATSESLGRLLAAMDRAGVSESRWNEDITVGEVYANTRYGAVKVRSALAAVLRSSRPFGVWMGQTGRQSQPSLHWMQHSCIMVA